MRCCCNKRLKAKRINNALFYVVVASSILISAKSINDGITCLYGVSAFGEKCAEAATSAVLSLIAARSASPCLQNAITTAAPAARNEDDTMTTNSISLDGLSLDDYRDLGRALHTAICCIDKLVKAQYAPRRRHADYEHASRMADEVLVVLGDCYLDAYHAKYGEHPDTAGAFPYPRYRVSCGGSIDLELPAMGGDEDASREQFDTFTTEYGIALDVD